MNRSCTRRSGFLRSRSSRSLVGAVLLSTFVVVGLRPASAQDAAADAPPAVNCPKPDGPVPVKASKAEMAKFQQRVDDYKACVNAYAAANMTKAKDLQAQAQGLQTQAQATQAQAVSTQARAQAYATAANGAIDAFNNYVAEINSKAPEAKTK